MFIVTWLFDKLGYMPKVTVDTTWPFPATAQEYKAPEQEKKVAKKTATRKPKVVAKTAHTKKAK
jgi:hypothetical protein